MDLLEGDVELTEFEAIDVRSIKGVGQGANGFPILMMKGLAAAKADGSHPALTGTHSHPHAANGSQGDDDTHEHEHTHDGDADHGHSHAEKSALDIAVKAVTDGKIDQGPDISLGHQIMGLLAQAIQAEAQEIGAGSYGETCDVDLLNCAASMISRWVGREAAPGEDDSSDIGILMASAAIKAAMSTKDINDLPDSAFAYIEPGHESEKTDGKTPGKYRHFPVHDKRHAANALTRLSSSPFGDKAKAKVHAAARKFGIDVSDDTSKSGIAEGGSAVDTETQETGGLAKAVEDAVTKAVAPLQERITALDAELAKVKAAPVPGGPVLSRNVQVKQPGSVAREDWAAKAAYYRDMAEQVTDRPTADGYRKLAREAEAKAAAPAS